MSYDVYIVDPETGEDIETDTPHHFAGGTYQVGGTTRLWLNITFNYSPFYYRADTLGESTKVYGEKPVNGALPVLREEYGGIPGLEYLSVSQARERVLRAINNLRDEPLDKDGKQYQLTEWDIEQGYTINTYWLQTEANARRALINLLQILCLAPNNAKIQVSY